eukprot:PhF_6_TR4472/c0_g1_i1/m.6125
MSLDPQQQSSTESQIFQICRQRGYTPVMHGPQVRLTSTSIDNTLIGSQSSHEEGYVIYFRERPDVTVFVSLRSSMEQILAVGCWKLIPRMNTVGQSLDTHEPP